ncbi:hypothetical protein KJ359_005428 [Pestalotiopsis sp. 9143b]|nr:hypothetical protein KJ359_005428 [Pestalotiopsis sp. 9143b]
MAQKLDLKELQPDAAVAPSCDVALGFLATVERVDFTQEDARRLCLTFGLQYLDKVTVSYAAVYGMRKDLGLVGSDYSWTSSLFYFGYLVAQGPSAYLLTKFPVGKYAAINIFLWGVMVTLCATTKNFTGLAILRFLMGVFESAIGPCWVTMMGMFYRNEEQGARVTSWYGFVGLAAIVGGLLSYGVGTTNTDVSQWKIVFLICGGFTVIWSVAVWFFLPSDPTTAYFLDERERFIAVERLRTNRTGLRSSKFVWRQAVEALVDPQCIMIALWAGISNICNIAGSFLPLIIQDMGFSGLQTTLLTLPVGGVEIVAMQ